MIVCFWRNLSLANCICYAGQCLFGIVSRHGTLVFQQFNQRFVFSELCHVRRRRYFCTPKQRSNVRTDIATGIPVLLRTVLSNDSCRIGINGRVFCRRIVVAVHFAARRRSTCSKISFRSISRHQRGPHLCTVYALTFISANVVVSLLKVRSSY